MIFAGPGFAYSANISSPAFWGVKRVFWCYGTIVGIPSLDYRAIENASCSKEREAVKDPFCRLRQTLTQISDERR